MPSQFKVDVSDVARIPGLRRPQDGEIPFLTPVFFRLQVLIKYFYDSRYSFSFVSDTYGIIESDNDIDYFQIPFGINKHRNVIMWHGVLIELPQKEIDHLRYENIDSDHDIESDFYESEIKCIFSDPPIETGIMITLAKIRNEFLCQFGFDLYTSPKIEIDHFSLLFSKFKKHLFNNQDDLKNNLIEWNKALVESINADCLKQLLLNNQYLKKDEKLQGNKLLERFLKMVLGVKDNIIAPFFHLNDLRIWAAHKDAAKKYQDACINLGISDNSDYSAVYLSLMKSIQEFLTTFLNTLIERKNDQSET